MSSQSIYLYCTFEQPQLIRELLNHENQRYLSASIPLHKNIHKIYKKKIIITFFQVPPPLAVIINAVEAIWLLFLQTASPL